VWFDGFKRRNFDLPLYPSQGAPIGQTVVITVGVTDAPGIELSASINLSGIDPWLAGEELALCALLHSMMEFVRPIYIDPGDPARSTRQPTFSPEALRNLSEMLTRMQGLIKPVQERGMLFNKVSPIRKFQKMRLLLFGPKKREILLTCSSIFLKLKQLISHVHFLLLSKRL